MASMLPEHCKLFDKARYRLIGRLVFFPHGNAVHGRSRFQGTEAKVGIAVILRGSLNEQYISDAAFNKQQCVVDHIECGDYIIFVIDGAEGAACILLQLAPHGNNQGKAEQIFRHQFLFGGEGGVGPHEDAEALSVVQPHKIVFIYVYGLK